MKDYHVNIFYSKAGYVADIPELQGCSAFSETLEKAIDAVSQAKIAWLAAAKAQGKPIPNPKHRATISLQFRSEIWESPKP